MIFNVDELQDLLAGKTVSNIVGDKETHDFTITFTDGTTFIVTAMGDDMTYIQLEVEEHG